MQRSTIQRLSFILFLALVLWGGYVSLVFFGIPVHGRVLLSDAGWQFVATVCNDESFFCRGVAGFLPTVFYTVSRASPFLWYGVIVLLMYGAFLGWRAYGRGSVSFSCTCKPWHVFMVFLGMVWLLFTVLTSASYDQSGKDVSFRQLIEPHPSVYRSDNPEGLTVLQENFDTLSERGCLRQTGSVREGVGKYTINTRCIQQSFFTIVVPQIGFQLFLLLVLLVAGRAALSLFRFRIDDPFTEAVVSAGLGACALIALLWLLAVFRVFTATAGWVLLVAVLLVGYQHVRHWVKMFFTRTFDVSRPWNSFVLLCAFLLLSLLAFNFLTVIRPFPIGWDDLGSYLNRPRLLVSYGEFLNAMSTFQWEYLSALGYLLYGFNSIFGSTAAMVINWMAGLLAVLAVMAFSRRFLGSGAGVIAGLLYYSLPLVGHFSFADMKTDNAVFLFQALGIFCLFVALFSAGESAEEPSDARPAIPWRWIVLSGVFCAFAFGTKSTAAMTITMLVAVLAGVLMHWSAFAAIVFLSFAVFESQGALGIANIAARVGWPFLTRELFLALALAASAAFGILAVVRARRSILGGLMMLALFLVSVGIGVAPWLLNNNVRAGNIVPQLLLKAPRSAYEPSVLILATPGTATGSRVLPPELALDPAHPACNPTGREEELGRYWGEREGWGHYLGLPWRVVMNVDSAGYYVTTSPVLLLLPLLLFLPFFWQAKGRWFRWLFLGTVFLIAQWIFLANGVLWYGIAMFLGFSVALETLYIRAPDSLNRRALIVLLLVGLLSCFAMRFWQFEQQRNLLEYPMGKASAAVMRERTVPYYDDIVDVLLPRHVQMKDRPYLFRVGTFIPYFIPRNLEVIGLTDHQLDLFSCLHQEQDDQLTLERFRALGFNSIIFDTNTATIERDENGSLHQKVQDFVDFLNNSSLGLQVLVNDMNAGVVFLLIP